MCGYLLVLEKQNQIAIDKSANSLSIFNDY